MYLQAPQTGSEVIAILPGSGQNDFFLPATAVMKPVNDIKNTPEIKNAN